MTTASEAESLAKQVINSSEARPSEGLESLERR